MKKKFLSFIFIILLLIFCIEAFFVLRVKILGEFVANHFFDNMNEIRKNGNYYFLATSKIVKSDTLYYENFYEEKGRNSEEIYKMIRKTVLNGIEKEDSNNLNYSKNHEIVSFNNINKTYRVMKSDIDVVLDASQLDYILGYFLMYGKTQEVKMVKSGEFDGKKCYILTFENNNTIYIDKENYYPIGGFLSDKPEEIFHFEIKNNCVTDEDIEIPDLSEYTEIPVDENGNIIEYEEE